jgi:adenylate cyclase
VPLLGIVMTGLHGVQQPETTSVAALGLSVAVLGGAALAMGALGMWAVADTVGAPLSRVRHALARVEAGDLGAEVRVDDGSEVGLLQDGVNRMVGGLRERERMRSLYGRQVGEDVARAALDGDGPALGGEVRDVAVLFVDLVGSTALAAERPPEEVVGLLNRFFGEVVGAAGDHGGWVNKFEGDAALCVFGAPVPHEDAAGAALRAARDLVARLGRELPEVTVGVGVSAGPAVAGWVGAKERFEYTVIGDPVNEAARLCDLAKTRSDSLLASEAIVARAGRGERARWTVGEPERLRGRRAATRVAVPVRAAAPVG